VAAERSGDVCANGQAPGRAGLQGTFHQATGGAGQAAAGTGGRGGLRGCKSSIWEGGIGFLGANLFIPNLMWGGGGGGGVVLDRFIKRSKADFGLPREKTGWAGSWFPAKGLVAFLSALSYYAPEAGNTTQLGGEIFCPFDSGG